jgi:broad specificity phosphatase PhoE
MARIGGFADAAEPIDEGGRAKAAAWRLDGPAPALVLASPALSATETAAAIGRSATPDVRLRDADHGRWTGLSLDTIAEAEPEALARWIAAPATGTPEGEPLDAVRRRVGEWLEEQRAVDGPILAITHPTVMRAALSHALDMPIEATMRIDIAPLTAMMLSCNRQWRLQELRRA